MVVFDPRRTETAKVATEHHFVRPGLRCVRAARDAAGAVRRRAGQRAGVRRRAGRRRGRRSPRSPPSGPRRTAACPPTRSAGWRASSPPRDGAVAYGRVGVSTHEFGSVCQWAVNLLNILTGNLDAVGGAMFTSPAIDAVGTGLIGRGHHDLWRSRVRGLPESAGRAAGGRAPRGDRDARRGADPGDADARPATRCCPPPTAPGSTPSLAGLDFMAAVDIYVNETTRHAARDPAADHRAGAGPLRPGLPHAGGPQHRALHPGRRARRRRTAATTGRSTARSRCAPPPGCPTSRPLKKRLTRRVRLSRQPDRADRPAAAPRRQGDHEAAARPPRGRRPRPAAGRTTPGRPAHDGTSASTSRPAWCSTTYAASTTSPPRPTVSCC